VRANPLAPAYEKAPAAPLPANFVPEGGVPHYVMDGEDFWVLASRYGFNDPWKLIEYNFRTRDPKEVNWYLRTRVGCVATTPDQKNWRFTKSAYPGIIYVPSRSPKPPGETNLLKTWAGYGALLGVHLVVGRAIGIFAVINVEGLLHKTGPMLRVRVDLTSGGFGVSLNQQRTLIIFTGIPSDRVTLLHGLRLSETQFKLDLGNEDSFARRRLLNILNEFKTAVSINSSQPGAGNNASSVPTTQSWFSRRDMNGWLRRLNVDPAAAQPRLHMFPTREKGFDVSLKSVRATVTII
jgi:hypothetical protein